MASVHFQCDAVLDFVANGVRLSAGITREVDHTGIEVHLCCVSRSEDNTMVGKRTGGIHVDGSSVFGDILEGKQSPFDT